MSRQVVMVGRNQSVEQSTVRMSGRRGANTETVSQRTEVPRVTVTFGPARPVCVTSLPCQRRGDASCA